jgi:hypothetical protein
MSCGTCSTTAGESTGLSPATVDVAHNGNPDKAVGEARTNPTMLAPVSVSIAQRQVTVLRVVDDIQSYGTDDKYKQGIDLAERKDTWSPSQQSRFIESALCRIPFNALWLAEDPSNSDVWEVWDGWQRLNSIRAFCIYKTLRLEGLEYWGDYEGVSFDELPVVFRRRILETPIPINLVAKSTPPDVRENLKGRIR